MVNRTFEGFMFHPPYLLIFPTAGADGRPCGNALLHSSWKSSRERKDVSMDSGPADVQQTSDA